MNDTDLITCAICGEKMNAIGWKHLKKHDITLSQYKEQFPGVPTASQSTIKKRAEAGIKRNISRKGVPRSKEVKEKIKATKQANPKEAWNKGLVKTEDQKQHISNIMKEKFREGKLIPHNRGKLMSDEQKAKISTTAKSQNRTISEAQKIKTRNTIENKKREGWVHHSTLRKGFKITDPNVLSKIREANQRTNQKKAEEANKKIREQCEQENLIVNKIDVGVTGWVHLKCKKCSTSFKYTKQIFKPSKRNGLNICPSCFPRVKNTSAKETLIFEFIKSIFPGQVEQGNRTILSGKEIDIYIPDKKIGFEFNGLFWHRETYYNGHKHHLHHKRCHGYKEGVRIIHIFEDEWDQSSDLVKSRIKQILNIQSHKIHARKCIIKDIDKTTKDTFLNQHHIMGTDISKIRYGAFYDNILVGVMTFKPSSFVKGGNGKIIELNRFAVKSNYSINGLASKMFRRFVNDHSPTTVLSYCDLRWNTGKSYQKMGFKLDSVSPPSYWYIDPLFTTRLHRSQFMKHKIVTEDTQELTEWEIMRQKGYDRIWDCGCLKYVWNAN